MPNASVIQLSDLHFGAGGENVHSPTALVEQVAELAQKLNNPIILASGDITFKAGNSGYEEAGHFFEQLRNATGLERKRFLFCPGNHDCHATDHFKAFDSFTYRIRRDDACTFSDSPCRAVTLDGLIFVLMNSVYHLDHKYGLVDVKALRRTEIADPQNTAVISHHHLIPTDQHDTSTTRNSYDLLTALDDMGIPVLLHGHQHVTKGLRVGKTPVHVVGVNSFNFAFRGGQNAVGVLEWQDGSVKFTRRIYLNDGVEAALRRYQVVDEVAIR